jgi:Domain of unknown function (DUF1990)
MFFVRRPSREAIDRFLCDSQELPLSYGPIGIVNGETSCRDLDEAIGTIGRGRTDFDRARAALMASKQFDIGWVEMFPRHAPVGVGTVVAILIQHLGFWSLNGCRVLYNDGLACRGNASDRSPDNPRSPPESGRDSDRTEPDASGSPAS